MVSQQVSPLRWLSILPLTLSLSLACSAKSAAQRSDSELRRHTELDPGQSSRAVPPGDEQQPSTKLDAGQPAQAVPPAPSDKQPPSRVAPDAGDAGVQCDFPPPLGTDAACPFTPIDGRYRNLAGDTHDIECWSWSDSARSGYYMISLVGDDFIVAQNSDDSDDSPCLWSRIQWTWLQAPDAGPPSEQDAGPHGRGRLFICVTTSDAATRAEAAQTHADEQDLTAGCHGSPWIELL